MIVTKPLSDIANDKTSPLVPPTSTQWSLQNEVVLDSVRCCHATQPELNITPAILETSFGTVLKLGHPDDEGLKCRAVFQRSL